MIQRGNIQHDEIVDGFEMAIDCRQTADLGAVFQIKSETITEFLRANFRRRELIRIAQTMRLRQNLQFRMHVTVSLQIIHHLFAFGGILAGERAAAE